MSPLPQEPNLPPSEAVKVPFLQRKFNRWALGVMLLVHLGMLMSVVLSPPRTVALNKGERSSEVVVYVPTVPEKIAEPPPPPPKLAPPPPVLPPPEPPKIEPPPKLDFKPDAIVAPPVVETPPKPPAPEAPPAPPASKPGTGTAKADAGTPANAGSGAPGAPKLFEDCEGTDLNIVADVYQLRTDTRSVNEMRRRKPIKRVCLAQLDITPRSFRQGFPGLDKMIEWFGLDIRFTVNVPETGTWELMLLSDDGATLTIDDKEVINNDGIHAALPEFATVKLEKGVRNFRIRYFQGPPDGVALMLGWKKPGAADFSYLPRKLIGRPPADSLAAIVPKE